VAEERGKWAARDPARAAAGASQMPYARKPVHGHWAEAPGGGATVFLYRESAKT